MKSFDEDYYNELMGRLEVSEVKMSSIIDGAETLRLDPEYYQKKYIDDELLVKSKPQQFVSFADLAIKVDASAFYPSIEEYYGQGTLPFLRVADVDTVIDFEECTSIPAELCSRFSTLSKVQPGDIVFTKGGSVARIGLVTQEAAASRDLIFLNSSKLNESQRIFLYLYFQTDFFNRSLIRSSSQTAQPHLTLTLVRELPVFVASDSFKDLCKTVVNKAFAARAESIRLRRLAEEIVSRELNLEKLDDLDPLDYVCNSEVVFSSDRLDAEYFKPKFLTLVDFIDATGQSEYLKNLVETNKRGKQPTYSEDGVIVVNSKHVNGGDVAINRDNRFGIIDESSLLIKNGDVVMNGTGVGTIGRAAPYLHSEHALPDNHVTVLRPHKGGIDPVYLAAFINSRAGQLQVEQRLRGSSGQIEIYPSDIEEFKIWVAPSHVQKQVRDAIEESFSTMRRAKLMLRGAKRSVEIAIEDDEKSAIAHLEGYLKESIDE